MKPTAFRGSNLNHETLQRICRWLKANGINPNRVPLDSAIKVTGSHVRVMVMHEKQIRTGGKRTKIVTRNAGLMVPVGWRTYRIRYDLKDMK